jgi:hypothetical protein
MTAETTTSLPPDQVLTAARSFFTGGEAVHATWVETESSSHVSFATFRSNIVVSAVPESGTPGATRVRVSSLRDAGGAVGRFLTFLSTASEGAASDTHPGQKAQAS